MGSNWVLILRYVNIVLSWPEDCRSRPKHVAKYNLILIIASCLDLCCVLTVQNILHKFYYTQRDGLSQEFKDYDVLEKIIKIHLGTQSMDVCQYWLGNLVPTYDKFLSCGGATCKNSVVYNNKSGGATALQGLGRQSGRRRSAKVVPTFVDRGVSRGQPHCR